MVHPEEEMKPLAELGVGADANLDQGGVTEHRRRSPRGDS
jgi:hypothetical protein